MSSICCLDLRCTLRMEQFTSVSFKKLQTRCVSTCRGMSARMVKFCCSWTMMTRRECDEGVLRQGVEHPPTSNAGKEPMYHVRLERGKAWTHQGMLGRSKRPREICELWEYDNSLEGLEHCCVNAPYTHSLHFLSVP
jgi:hypothetical protein